MAHGHELVLVGTAPAAEEYTAGPPDFAALAEEAGAPYFCDPAINRPEYRRLVEEAGAEVAISVMADPDRARDARPVPPRGGERPRRRPAEVPRQRHAELGDPGR